VPYYTTDFPSTKHNKLESPLKAKGELCVGYGSGRYKPLTSGLWRDQDLDLGFLKIYLSTQPVDLSGTQSGFLEWPRTTTRLPRTTKWHFEPQDAWYTAQDAWDAAQDAWDAAQDAWDAAQDAWDTILIPIIQRRGPNFSGVGSSSNANKLDIWSQNMR
jgi:hypothetical protein